MSHISEISLKLLRRRYNLKVDGLFGRQTAEALYEDLFQCVAPKTDGTMQRVIKIAEKIKRNKKHYIGFDIPWQLVGILHYMECNLSFNRHLHNGDPLNKKTVRVPRGRPSNKTRWTWRESAADAISMKLREKPSWKNPPVNEHTPNGHLLLMLEEWNGLGYWKKGILSPFLFGNAQRWIYDKGKYVADGRFDRNARTAQIGAALLLRALL